MTITSASSIVDAAAIHCRYFYSSPRVWEVARTIRDHLVGDDPESWDLFWEEVDGLVAATSNDDGVIAF